MRRIVASLVSILLAMQFAGVYRATPLDAADGACFGDGVSGRRIHIWYAWETEDRYDSDVAEIREALVEADARLAAVGGQHFRFLCAAGEIVVSKVRTSSSTREAFSASLRAMGYSSSNRIYNAFAPEGRGGSADTTSDDRADPRANVANTGPRYSVQGISAGMFMHEIGHNLGAVQRSAPHSSGYSHCWDGQDVMCYDDGGPYFQEGGEPQRRCGYALLDSATRWDCNLDDYYNPNPPAGSYLATHWNIRNSYFLTSVPTPPPAPGDLRMTGHTTSSITMAWDAVYDPDGISTYSLEIRRNRFADYAVICETTEQSCTATGVILWGNGNFQFRVRARDGAGTWGPYSETAFGDCAIEACI